MRGKAKTTMLATMAVMAQEEDAVDNDAPKLSGSALRDEFRAYTDNAFKNYAPFTKDETVAIRCMHVLQDEGA
jgi:hypothetical protein